MVAQATARPGSGRTDDAYVVKGIEMEQIVVAGDDGGCAATQCDIQEFVVFGVAAGTDMAHYGDEPRYPAEQLNESFPLILGEVGIELGAVQYPDQLGQGGFGHQ